MLNLDSKNIRFLARMGARGTLGQVVYDYLRDERELYVVTADLMHASGFDRIKKEFPESLVNVGIAVFRQDWQDMERLLLQRRGRCLPLPE